MATATSNPWLERGEARLREARLREERRARTELIEATVKRCAKYLEIEMPHKLLDFRQSVLAGGSPRWPYTAKEALAEIMHANMYLFKEGELHRYWQQSISDEVANWSVERETAFFRAMRVKDVDTATRPLGLGAAPAVAVDPDPGFTDEDALAIIALESVGTW